MRRRTVVTGLAGLAATTALPALAQGIGRQTDPYGQVDPYADPRNGGRGNESGRPSVTPSRPREDVFTRDSEAAESETDDLEIQMGMRSLESDIEEFGGLYPNEAVQDAMQHFCIPFLSVADRRHLPWRVFIPNKQDINAFAGLGGKMFFLPGIISLCDHPIELAAIVAHEIGHIDHRHSFEKMQTAKMLAAGMEASKASAAMKNAGSIIGTSMMDVLMKGYSRENEFEADAHIVTLFNRVGLDPTRADDIFRRMLVAFHERPNEQTSLFSTHPGTVERIANIEREAAQAPGSRSDVTLPGWSVLKAAFPTPTKWKSL